jgi:hypothetical protein
MAVSVALAFVICAAGLLIVWVACIICSAADTADSRGQIRYWKHVALPTLPGPVLSKKMPTPVDPLLEPSV